MYFWPKDWIARITFLMSSYFVTSFKRCAIWNTQSFSFEQSVGCYFLLAHHFMALLNFFSNEKSKELVVLGKKLGYVPERVLHLSPSLVVYEAIVNWRRVYIWCIFTSNNSIFTSIFTSNLFIFTSNHSKSFFFYFLLVKVSNKEALQVVDGIFLLVVLTFRGLVV